MLKKINSNLNKIKTSNQEKDRSDLINKFIDKELHNKKDN